MTNEDEDGLKDLAMLRDVLSWSPKVRKWASSMFFKDGEVIEDYSDESWRLLSQARVSKFNESEYHVPKEQGFACFKEICDKMDNLSDTYFPIELRVIKGDDAWLSPFYKRDCHPIAIHSNNHEKWKYLVEDFGAIYRKYEGRPHWGKLNNMTADELEAAYPMWSEFKTVREQCDPEGKLLNNYLSSIFKPETYKGKFSLPT